MEFTLLDGFVAALTWENLLYAAVGALLGTLIGVLPGIGLGVVLALLLLIYRASYPGTAELGKLPAEHVFRDVSLHPEAERVPGLLIYRFDSSLIRFLYAKLIS